MEENLKRLSVLFRDTLFRIPDYQRGYAWEQRNFEDFWNDITNLKDSPSSDHYIGVLTTQLVSKEDLSKEKWDNDRWLIENKHYLPVYIVDGQQRLTTVVLFIAAIVKVVEEKFPSCRELNYTAIANIKERYLYEKKSNSDVYSCIFGYEKKDSSFDYYCKEILDIPVYGFSAQKTKYTENLNEGYQYFKDKLNDLSLIEIEEYFKIITKNLVFNIYQISDSLDVFVTFETMNNRGKTLSNLELLKNRLIYLTTIAKDDPEDKMNNMNIRNEINNSWKVIYSYLGKNENEMLDDERFLNAHMTVYQNINNLFINKQLDKDRKYTFRIDNGILLDSIFTRKNLQEDKITINDVRHFAQRLSENAKLWYELHNPEKGKYDIELCDLIYKYKLLMKEGNNIYYFMRPQSQWMTEIFKFFVHNSDEKLRSMYLKFIIRFTLSINAFRRVDNVLEFLFEIGDELSSYQITAEQIKDANKTLKSILKSTENKQALIKSIEHMVKEGSRSNDYEGVNFYKNDMFPTEYVLKTYELSLLEKNLDYKNDIERKKNILLSRENNLEHILPQKYDDWKNVFNPNRNGNEKKVLVNMLGNLVYINMNKNRKLANKTFELKKGTLGSDLGYINGSYSEKEIAKEIEWTEKEIYKRSIKLLNHYLELLHMPSLNNTDKKSILGLGFM